MTWRKYFSRAGATNGKLDGTYSAISAPTSKPGPARSNFSSFLPDVYTGAPNRVERYQQYDTMNMDSEVNAALDILAEFCTQVNTENQTPFSLYFKRKATSTEISILREYLQQWCRLQEFDTRIFRIVRNIFMYGDTFFLRDPQTKKWMHIEPSKVVKIIVNESEGKEPEQYVIKDLAPNFRDLVVTAIDPNASNSNNRGTSYVAGGAAARGMVGAYPANASSSGSRFQLGDQEVAVDANHVIHISLSEGLDNNYPFGNSLLETVFKVYKQKELLEDAIIIYRVQRAPERRVFYIDVGNMPPHLAMSFVERVKNEIHQRRIPSVTGGGANVIDSGFNPLSTSEDFFFPQGSDGRGSKVDTLPGGCFAMDTKVQLTDGRHLTIREIEHELSIGKELWTYSCKPGTSVISPGVISWAGVTHQSAEVMKLTLSNGETITCTPDHKFATYGQEYVKAEDITPDTPLIAMDKWSTNRVLSVTMISDLYREIKKPSLHVVKKEWLLNPIEVGTLTIDKEETYNSYHTFALSAGTLVFNSNLGEIDDLRYFTNKLMRGLRIPSSYLPTGAEDSQSQFNDGRVGTAYIQELRFNKYCERLQSLLQRTFDEEFKLYLYDRGINIDPSIFDLKFEPPQNFASYRQAELDTQRIPLFAQINSIPMLSKRFALKRFLGLSTEEIHENELLWAEENGKSMPTLTDSSGELRGVGISQAGIQNDVLPPAPPPEMAPPGGEVAPDGAMETSPGPTTAPPQ